MVLGLTGCGSSGDSPLVVATTWPLSARTRIEAAVGASLAGRPIDWVILAPGERLESVVDRRGGVDVLLGIMASSWVRLDPSSWRAVRRPEGDDPSPVRSASGPGDPRVDPESFARAKAALGLGGWPAGYEGLVRGSGKPWGIGEGSSSLTQSEYVALVQGGPNQERAIKFLQSLEARGLAGPMPANPLDDVASDGLLADLLGSSLVDAREELREATAALARFEHPAKAEAALGERPPWPPASVAKLLVEPNGVAMVETLLAQIAPDPESRAWLLESWSQPKRPIDGALLAELAGVLDGRLAREPRFRAWLRGEWTAWSRQLYRRVARLAGGYIPS